MNDEYHWCHRHNRVEASGETCPERYLLGPYPTAAAARNWRQQRDAREDRWEAQDEAWEGE
ncbi:MAG TPA: hypothetical protein VFZ70_10925 [Euzebyales bacterium]